MEFCVCLIDQLVLEGSSAPTTCASTRLCSVTAGTTVETAATRTTAVSPNHGLWIHFKTKNPEQDILIQPEKQSLLLEHYMWIN